MKASSGLQNHPLSDSKFSASLVALLLLVALARPALPQGISSKPKTSSVAQPPPAQLSAQDQVKLNLEKDKLTLEIAKLRIENANEERSLTTTRGLLNLLYGNVSVIVAIVLGFIGLVRYLKERREELLRREDERFEEVVKGLGSEQYQQRVSSAMLLPTFLRKGYERFYLQVFNLAAGNLRMGADTDRLGTMAPRTSPEPLTVALTSVLREAYPRARDNLKEQPKMGEDVHIDRYLNAAGIQLNRAFLEGVDFRHLPVRGASFREAKLRGADLTGAILEGGFCHSATLTETTLRGANLKGTDFTEAILKDADLSEARADGSKFTSANLANLIMEGGTIGGADFAGADLSGAKFRDVKFATALPEGKRANPEAARNLAGTIFETVTGLTEAQISLCKEKGAHFGPAVPR